MKSHFLLVLGASSIGLAICGCDRQKHTSEDETAHGLIIRRAIPEDKWREILNILNADSVTDGASPRKLLYRIRNYKPNQEPKDIGEMADEMVHEDFNVPANFEGHAVQIGLGFKADIERLSNDTARSLSEASPSPSPEPSSTPITLHAHFQKNLIESQLMVSKVKGILDRETPSPSP